MLVVSWNMGANSVSRKREVHGRAWGYLRALDPDLAIVQEAVPPDWAREHWQPAVIMPGNPWSSAILAKPALGLRAIEAPAEANLNGGLSIAIGQLKLATGETLVASVHAPVMMAREADLVGRDPEEVKLPSYPRPSLRDVAFFICRDLFRGKRFLASGDWNTSPQLWDWSHPSDREADFFTRAAEAGWVDCYRQFHQFEGRTWFRGNDLPYQQDHAFCDPKTALSLRSCVIDPCPAELQVNRVSDHAPLLLALDI